METKFLNIVEYQNKILEIYDYTQKVFEQHGIKMIAHSGTLLGIIRHDKDFIPWDDDLDVLVSYKELEENYDSIEKEINSVYGKYHIFNFVRGEKNIKANLFFLRVYSREKVFVDIDGNKGEPYPFIDIMIGAPADSFKTELGWKLYSRRHQMYWMTRKGFNRYQREQHRKFKTFLMNLQTYPLKLFYYSWLEDKRIRKPWNPKKGNWNIIRRTDPWTKRKVNYDFNELTETKIRGKKIWISKNYESELLESFGKNWKNPIVMHAHSYGVKHTKHQRNIQIIKFLDDKYN